MTPEQELEHLINENGERMAKLMQAGARLGGITEHYIVSLLETLLAAVGPDALVAGKLMHERWLQPQLDQAEATHKEMLAAAATERERRQQAANEEAIKRGMPLPGDGPHLGPSALKDGDFLQRVARHVDTHPLPAKRRK